jgi:hypothetical protein
VNALIRFVDEPDGEGDIGEELSLPGSWIGLLPSGFERMVGLKVHPSAARMKRHGEPHFGIELVPTACGRSKKPTDRCWRWTGKGHLHSGVERIAEGHHRRSDCHL